MIKSYHGAATARLEGTSLLGLERDVEANRAHESESVGALDRPVAKLVVERHGAIVLHLLFEMNVSDVPPEKPTLVK